MPLFLNETKNQSRNKIFGKTEEKMEIRQFHHDCYDEKNTNILNTKLRRYFRYCSFMTK